MASEKNLQGKKFVSQGQIKKMDPMQRARYLAYEKPRKSIAESLLITKKRLKEHALRVPPGSQGHIQDSEQERQTKVVGELKAAEAKNRIHLMRVRYQSMRAHEINHMISCQPTARQAIELEMFLPPQTHTENPRDPLRGNQRDRVENLLKDDRGLLTNRIP